ncbi:MAG: N-acetylmuramoyl-L-alanine amidase [Paludibacteraceae bacterium]|nr:N-acetylmuramoyl-L-alanine amidase [Paludibacteraceae bacterium]
MNYKNIFFRFSGLLLAFFLLQLTYTVQAQKTNFTLVLDAGHGGHDPGAVGAIAREKDLNLNVILRLGALVEKNFKDVKVVYTRKTDKYLTLQQRADVVNSNHADLFISVHTNAAKSSAAYGAETFTLGLAKSKANLDVAMRENSVILLEDDYKAKYKGFDPNSVDSYIMFEFMQDKYIDKSIDLASNIQKQFVNYARRSDRGVRQAGFWVLHRSACPSVLIELGFISNKAEERYMASENGQKELATSIYNAFVRFKHDHDKKSGVAAFSTDNKEILRSNDHAETDEPEQKPVADNKPVTDKSKPAENDAQQVIDNAFANNTTSITSKNAQLNHDVPVFRVQILASGRKLNADAADFKGQKNTNYFVENGLYKYTVGSETDYNKISNIHKELRSRFPDCFIIAFVGDKKMSAKDALKLIK